MKHASSKLSSDRAMRLTCGKKGVGYASHADTYGYKDYSRALYRYCKAGFKMASKEMK